MAVKVSTRGNPIEPAHLNNLMAGLRGWGVQSGLAVAQKAAGADMSVDVAIGVAVVNNTIVTKSATTNVAITAADATYDRYDLIVINSSGTVSSIDGVAATTAYANDYDLVTNNAILLAEVYVPTTDTTIEDAQITDFRNILQGLNNTTNGHDHDGANSKEILSIVTDGYTGDGELSQEVATGLGTIKGLKIYQATGNYYTEKTDQHAATGAHQTGAQVTYTTTEFAAGFSGGSFFVDDNGGDSNPNTDGVPYIYIAWGEA